MTHYLIKIERFTVWKKAFTYLIENNTSAHLPYHNTRHCINVFDTAINIADGCSNLNDENIINLGIACLFHDINHSGGKLDDQQNIQIAVTEFLKFYVSLSDRLKDYIDITKVNELIQYTIFPRIATPTFVIDKIIMDSDLIQCYDHDWFIFAIKGLADERGIPVKQALLDQGNFINNVTYYTEFAQKLHNERKDDYLLELDNLKTIFN